MYAELPKLKIAIHDDRLIGFRERQSPVHIKSFGVPEF